MKEVLSSQNHQKSTNVALVAPTLNHEEEALRYRTEFLETGMNHITGSSSLQNATNYEEWLLTVRKAEMEELNGFVKCFTYFGMIDNRIVGIIQIRHRLTEGLLRVGGHIGYSVRPAERRKGYATQMLSQSLDQCRKLGMSNVLITCDKDNVASAKTIQRCGGVLENEIVTEDGTIKQRYWIKI